MTDETSHKKWIIGTLIGAAAVIVAAVAIVVPYWQNENNRKTQAAREDAQRREDQWRENVKRAEDQQRIQKEKQLEENRNRPHLKYDGGSGLGSDGYTRLKFTNTSPTRNAIVTSITLRVTEPVLLRKIAQYHPRVPPTAGAGNDHEEVRLIHGAWNPQTSEYLFFVYPEFHVAPDKPIDIRTCIVDSAMPIMDITGEFDINVSGGTSDTPKASNASFSEALVSTRVLLTPSRMSTLRSGSSRMTIPAQLQFTGEN